MSTLFVPSIALLEKPTSSSTAAFIIFLCDDNGDINNIDQNNLFWIPKLSVFGLILDSTYG
ncbi:unnamed protein product [Meloidogyne enterolobii]|uniref:Uncharacterized protein n=1 Tax=Meloidogyne enterolobii TaxID=390850 RepID=A0ACB0XYQ4_MELEN